ncbi:MAG: HNH endonuclease [Alphaproteobacteria bacterium]
MSKPKSNLPYAWKYPSKPDKSYRFVHQKRDAKDEKVRQSIAKKLARTPKSERLDPAQVPDTCFDIPCVMMEFKVPPLEERQERRREFETGVRADFIRHLARTQYKELRAAGITDKQIRGMRQGYTPNGFNTHHMVPIHGGGTNDFSNLILMRRVPYHDMLHNQVINPQIRGIQEGESITIKIPFSDKKVFVPDARFLPMQKEAQRQAEIRRKENLEKKKNKNKNKKKPPQPNQVLKQKAAYFAAAKRGGR